MLFIELRRRELGLTQAKLAQLSGIAQTVISQIELGRYLPTPDQKQRLADSLALAADNLIRPIRVVTDDNAVAVLPDPSLLKTDGAAL